MSNVSKGTRNEKRCEDSFSQKGYIVWRTMRVKYRNMDIFGLFDVCALHPEGKEIVFIQVKSNKVDKKTRDAIRNLKMPEGCKKSVWIWRDYKGWIKERYD